MNADAWLEKNGKAPFSEGDDDYADWFWGSPVGYDGLPSADPDDQDMILPAELFDRLTPKTSYPMVKPYRTREEALDDFRRAFAAAVAAGWVPE